MAGGSIKGITIEFRGETTKLSSALRKVNKETAEIDKELKNVDKALKFNPTSIELWRQKQDLLQQKIGDTEEKLNLLKKQQAAMDTAEVDKQSVEYQKLQREIITTESKLAHFNAEKDKLEHINLKVASEQFKQWGSSLETAGQKMAGLSTAAAGVVASIGAITYKAGTNADDLNTLSKVYGISTADLQKYKYAADLVDVSVEDIAKSHVKLEKSMYAASSGSKTQSEAFKKLGVSVTNADGSLRSSDEVFQDVITSLGSMENETERDALAQQLLGKSAASLNPLIEDQGETYKEVADTMSKYNLEVVDQETLDKANEFNDALDTMKLLGQAALAQVGSQLAAVLAPALEKVVGWFGKFAQWLGNLNPKVLTAVGIVASVLAVLAPVLMVLGKLAFSISSIITLVTTIGPAVVGALATAAPIIAAVAAIIAIGVLLYKNWDTIKAKAKQLWTSIKTTFAGIKSSITSTINAVKTYLSSAWSSIKTTAESAWNKVKDAITSPIKKAKSTIDGIIQGIKDLFPINVGNLMSNIKLPHFSLKWSSKDFGPLGSIKYPTGISFDGWWAKGGIFSSPSVIGVGEAGPEAVVPLDKLWGKLDKIAEGSGSPTIIINGYNKDPKELAEEVVRILIKKTNNERLAWT